MEITGLPNDERTWCEENAQIQAVFTCGLFAEDACNIKQGEHTPPFLCRIDGFKWTAMQNGSFHMDIDLFNLETKVPVKIKTNLGREKIKIKNGLMSKDELLSEMLYYVYIDYRGTADKLGINFNPVKDENTIN